MGRRGDMKILWNDINVDAAELTAGWRYQLINSQPRRNSCEEPLLSMIEDIA
jgi:hypothetical protein